jgi:hypothetical protein
MDPHGGESRNWRRRRERRHEARQRLLAPRLVFLFLTGCLLFGYPLLGLLSRPLRVAGIPILYVYIFLAWGAFIAALAWLVDAGDRR